MKQLLQEAVDLLDDIKRGGLWLTKAQVGTVDKIRTAIDAPEQEPVAWINPAGTIAWSQHDMDNFDDDIRCRYSVPLYTKPQPVAELTDAAQDLVDMLDAYHDQLVPVNRKSVTCKTLRAVLAVQKAKR